MNIFRRTLRANILHASIADMTGWMWAVGCPRCRDRRELRADKVTCHSGGTRPGDAVLNWLRCSAPRCGAAPNLVLARDRQGGREVMLVGPAPGTRQPGEPHKQCRWT